MRSQQHDETRERQSKRNRKTMNSNHHKKNTMGSGSAWLGLLLLAASIGISEAAKENNHKSLRSRNLIIGGGTAPDNRFPYYVALKDKNKEIQCGGTLIAPDIVLTAAHCRNSDLVYAEVGKYSVAGPEGLGEEIGISNPLELMTDGWTTIKNLQASNASVVDATGFLHPEHDIQMRSYDVMLVKLNRTAAPGTPLIKVNEDPRVPVKQPGGKNEITIIGMGSTAINTDLFDPHKAEKLKQVHVDYLPYEECIDVQSYNLDYKFELLPHMICTLGAGTYSDRGQCFGDSGGPYIALGATAADDVQVGVVSWSVNCANSVFPMVGSRTSDSMKFIREVTCAVSAAPPAELCFTENNAVEGLQQRLDIPNGVTVSVRIFADPWGHELMWQITDQLDETKVYAEAPYGKIKGDHSFQEVVVPAGGDLMFKIKDAADDGIAGDAEAILYEVVLVDQNGELVMVEGNGAFGTSRVETFRVPQVNEEYLALVRASNAADSERVATPAGTPTAPFKIYIKFAEYHEDASWKVTSPDGAKVFASKLANEYRYGVDVTEEIELPAGDYKFTISDRRGTDDFRAFQSYKLSYLDRQQRSGAGGETTVYESQGLFVGEQISHAFVIPVTATVGSSAHGQSTSPEVVIGSDFLAEAEVQLCKEHDHYCTANEQCCSGLCPGSRCYGGSTGTTTVGAASGGGVSNSRDRLSLSGSSGGAASRGGYTRD